MGEFEDKLSKILSSPEDMEKIAGLARSLSGGSDAHEAAAQPEAPTGGARDDNPLSGLLGGLDPMTLNIAMRLMREYSSGGSDKTALIDALRPYLREDKRAKIDRAAEIAKLARIARVAFAEFSGGGGDV
jgi:hypothetical protein